MKSLFAVLLLAAGLAHAQDPAASYPNKPIRIYGQGTGSTADYLSRYVAQKLTERSHFNRASRRRPSRSCPSARGRS